MKIRSIAAAVALALIAWTLTSCTTITAPDGTVTTAPDPVAYQAALLALDAYSRAHPVHPDK